MSEYVKVDSGEDIFGKPWEVGMRRGVLVVTFGEKRRVFDDEDGGREKFAEAVARAVTPGVRVKHGPACGCTPCKAEPSYEARRQVSD